jgi:hypothetical protein
MPSGGASTFRITHQQVSITGPAAQTTQSDSREMGDPAAGVASVHLGAILLINLELGYLTPSQAFEGS